MRIAKGAKAVAASAVLMIASAPLAAQAEVAGGVIGCDASGNKQGVGAVVGGVLGGVVGSNLANNDKTTGTVLGAGAGAAAGSYVGCRMQKSDAAKAAAGPVSAAPAPERYAQEGYDERRVDARQGAPGHPHHMPPGQAKKHFGVGQRLPAAYAAEPRHYLTNPRRYGLRYAPAGHRWVVVGDDAYMVRTRTGVITDVARSIFG